MKKILANTLLEEKKRRSQVQTPTAGYVPAHTNLWRQWPVEGWHIARDTLPLPSEQLNPVFEHIDERLAMLEGAVQGSEQPLTQEQINQLFHEQNKNLTREMQVFLRSEVQTQTQTAAGLFQKDKKNKKIKQKQTSANPFRKSAITQERFTQKAPAANPFANIQRSSSPEITGEKPEDVIRHSLPAYMTALEELDINNDKALSDASNNYYIAKERLRLAKANYDQQDENITHAKKNVNESKEAYATEIIRAKKKLYAKEMDANRQKHKAIAKEITELKKRFLTSKTSATEDIAALESNTLADIKKIRSSHLAEIRVISSINEEDIVEHKTKLSNSLFALISEGLSKEGKDFEEEDKRLLLASNDQMYHHQQKLATLRNSSLPSAQTARELYLKNIDSEANRQIDILEKYKTTESVLSQFDFSTPKKNTSYLLDADLVHDPRHDFLEDTTLLRVNQDSKTAISQLLKNTAILGELNSLRLFYSEKITDASKTLAEAEAKFDQDYLEKSRLGQLTPQQRMGLIEARQDKLERVTKPAVNIFRKQANPSTGLQEVYEHDPTWGLLRRSDSR